MSTIGERIRDVRDKKKMTLAEFGEAINISAASVSKIENGINNPSKQTIQAIIDKFDVDEAWLRSDVGKMEPERPRKDAINAYCGQLMGGKRTETEELLIEIMAETTVEQWEALTEIFKKIAEKMKTP